LENRDGPDRNADVTRARNRKAELAEVTLDAMARYAGALQGLPDAPTEFGAYLIAHNVGLRDALADWLTRDHVRETAALQGDNDEP
jgi:hypothetical protein